MENVLCSENKKKGALKIDVKSKYGERMVRNYSLGERYIVKSACFILDQG